MLDGEAVIDREHGRNGKGKLRRPYAGGIYVPLTVMLLAEY